MSDEEKRPWPRVVNNISNNIAILFLFVLSVKCTTDYRKITECREIKDAQQKTECITGIGY